jgi:hypothetical protein
MLCRVISAFKFSGTLDLEYRGIAIVLNDGNIASKPTNLDVHYCVDCTF